MIIFKNYLLSKPYTLLDYPFGKEVMVFKVKGKMFATLGRDRNSGCFVMSLKCDPQEAVTLRDAYKSVVEGFHMNKIHWNTIILDDSVPQSEIERMVDNSFTLVMNTLSKKVRKLMEL